MAFKINNKEWDALYDEPWWLFKLYMLIRKVMDFETKMSGIKTHINESFFRENLGWTSRQGRNASEPITRKKIRWWIECLEKKGIIKHHGNFVFECLLADSEKSNQNITGPYRAKGGAGSRAKQNNENTPINKDLFDNKESEVGPEVGPTTSGKWGPPLVSGNTYLNKEHLDMYRPKKTRHVLPGNFVVTDHHVQLAKKNGWPAPDKEIDSFRNHHLGMLTKWCDWNRAFYNWLRKAKDFNKGAKNETHTRSPEKSKTDLLWEVCGQSAQFHGVTYDVIPERIDDDPEN